MPPKKSKKSSSPVRYLLSADRRLQKLSLRKVSASAARKTKSAARSMRAAATQRGSRATGGVGVRALVLGAALCITAAVALIAARQPSAATDAASVAADPGVDTLMQPVDPPSTDSEMTRRPATAAPTEAAARATTERKRPEPEPAPARAVPVPPPATSAAPAPPPTTSALSPKPAVSSVPTAVASGEDAKPAPDAAGGGRAAAVTGCIKFEEQQYWLTDTAGVDAPKSRSWRSGFLRRRSAPIQLVDAANGLKLWSRVGQRVEATGTLDGRELHARSLRQVAASCR